MGDHVAYKMTRGELWDRLVIIKDRRTHRVMSITQARCMVDLGFTKKSIPVEITTEGGIYLRVEPSETLDYPIGSYSFDIVAPIRDYWKVVARGTIAVSNMDNITPLEDGQQMEIRFKKGEDYRNTFAWYDSAGALITVTNAYMQAKNTAGTTVLDLRWFATAPNETAIAALTANQRGYLSPYTGQTLELHISELNSIPAGTYDFDLFVQQSSGDWTFLSGGTIVVESSISTRPV